MVTQIGVVVTRTTELITFVIRSELIHEAKCAASNKPDTRSNIQCLLSSFLESFFIFPKEKGKMMMVENKSR